jgi:GNAT superfamily N-acetyltransferase
MRCATLNDIPLLKVLINDSVRALSRDYYAERQIDSALIYIFGVDTQLIIDGTYFVEEEEGQLIGAGGWSKRATLFGGDQFKSAGPDPLLDPLQDPARLRAFYVHPNWARQGIGRRIVTACEDAAFASGFQRLELLATLPGEPLYAALGYSRIEPVEVTMPDGISISGYRMGKELSLQA